MRAGSDGRFATVLETLALIVVADRWRQAALCLAWSSLSRADAGRLARRPSRLGDARMGPLPVGAAGGIHCDDGRAIPEDGHVAAAHSPGGAVAVRCPLCRKLCASRRSKLVRPAVQEICNADTFRAELRV